MRYPSRHFRRWVGFLISGAGLVVVIGDALGLGLGLGLG